VNVNLAIDVALIIGKSQEISITVCYSRLVNKVVALSIREWLNCANVAQLFIGVIYFDKAIYRNCHVTNAFVGMRWYSERRDCSWEGGYFMFNGDSEEVLQYIFSVACQQKHRIILSKPTECSNPVLFICLLTHLIAIMQKYVDSFSFILLKLKILTYLLYIFFLGLLNDLGKKIILHLFIKLLFFSI